MDDSLWQDEAQLANAISDSPGFNFNSVAKFRKNLTETFDKELSDVSVLNRIDHFEAKRAPFCAAVISSEQLPSNRPPLPTRTVFAKPNHRSVKRVAVYLRIRPITTVSSSSPSKKSSKNDTEEKETSTIEVLKPVSNSKSRPFSTTIRTYPPNCSNTYKVNVNRLSQDNYVHAKEFHFDRVMGPEISQNYVYSAVAAPMIEDLFQASHRPSSSSKLRRESALLFSYGITNAGKTFTVLGDLNSTNQANWGIIPRAISDVLDRNRIYSVSDSSIECKRSPPFDLYISFFEIYNDNVYDLLPSNKSISSKNSVNHSVPVLKVRECRGQIFVRGLTKHKVNTVEHGVQLTKLAHNKRHTSSNNLNSNSSRSHFICQLQIIPQVQPTVSFPIRDYVTDTTEESRFSSVEITNGYSTDEDAKARSRQSASTIWIVDLAGSERSKRTRVGSTRQKESTKINKSLMTLMRCLNTMRDNGKRGNASTIVPFRESKLTHLFQGHLTGKSAARTAMMVNVNPSVEDFDETQYVLAYARKAKLIEMNQEQFRVKRNQFFGEEYDHNGRKRTKYEDKKNPPTIVTNKPKSILSQIVKKLSPKKALKRNPLKTEKVYISSNSDMEIETLKESLREVQAHAEKLEIENMRLLDELNNSEIKIRTECASEMEERLRETRIKHNKKYEYLISVMNSHTSKTDISVSMNRAGSQLEEDFVDKIDECEKEIFRMNEEHSNELEEYNKQLYIAAKEKVENVSKIASLECALKESNGEIKRLQQPRSDNNVTVETKEKSPEHYFKEKTPSFQKQLRPRKPLENFTNQTKG